MIIEIETFVLDGIPMLDERLPSSVLRELRMVSARVTDPRPLGTRRAAGSGLSVGEGQPSPTLQPAEIRVQPPAVERSAAGQG